VDIYETFILYKSNNYVGAGNLSGKLRFLNDTGKQVYA